MFCNLLGIFTSNSTLSQNYHIKKISSHYVYYYYTIQVQSIIILLSTLSPIFAVPCALGSIYNIANNTCKFCPPSQYQDEMYQISCKSCPNGTVTEKQGTNSLDDCIGMVMHKS